MLSKDDTAFLSYLRGLSILAIVLGHLGGWIYKPYTEFIGVFVPIFFFISGAVSYLSFLRKRSFYRYMKKRIIGLLVPYYGICVFSLLVYIYLHLGLPDFSLTDLVCWITVNPRYETMPFPIGQVWFLHTLLIIIIFSPIYFILYEKNKIVFILLIFTILLFSAIELFFPIHKIFLVLNTNLYKPFIHSLFFLLGIGAFFSNHSWKTAHFIFILILGIILSVLLVYSLELNPDYEYHTYWPDLYYVVGSLSAIAMFLAVRGWFVRLVAKFRVMHVFLSFMYTNTFSIFLLHSFAIYFAEETFNLVHPEKKTILYAVTKLLIVMTITCILAVPFSLTSKIVIQKLANTQYLRKDKPKALPEDS